MIILAYTAEGIVRQLVRNRHMKGKGGNVMTDKGVAVRLMLCDL